MHIAMNVSFKCNRRCRECWVFQSGIDKKYNEMDYTVWINWLRNFKDPLNIDITGGEPLIYPGIYQILREVDSKHTWAITTNLLSDDWRMLAEKFDNCVMVNISLHEPEGFVKTLIRAEEIKEAGNPIGFNVVSGVVDLRFEIEHLLLEGYNVNYTPYMPYLGLSRYNSINEWTCDGGVNSLFVAPNGDVFRCWTEIKCSRVVKPLWNINDTPISQVGISPCYLNCEEPQRLGYCGVKVLTKDGVEL